ncbi:MAG: NFACT family protein [Lachnospiraceae bacterium]|nr:NFACT family protein [Lachnospiraceae bacterium]
MAFDGVMVSALVSDLNDKLAGGRISKIIQPEKDEIILNIKGGDETFRLMLSANASLPLIALVDENKKAPMTAPAFCMFLRKHIAGGHITAITQPGLERVVEIDIEHLDEMGDLCRKKLITELMGKHSNIIFCDDKGMILESVKHIPASTSSVRQVLPGREYFIVGGGEKKDLIKDDVLSDETEFIRLISSKAGAAGKVLYTTFTGLSPVMAQDLCFRARIDADRPLEAAGDDEKQRLYREVCSLAKKIKDKQFSPCIIKDRDTGDPVEFGAFPMALFSDCICEPSPDASKLIIAFYGAKSRRARIMQKSADLRHIVGVVLERQSKKLDLQLAQLKDTEKRDKLKVCGELLHTYGYQAKEGDKSITVPNYYTNEDITIRLDPQKSAMENAAAYFDRYAKLKRTFETLSVLIKETEAEKEHLESVLTALDLAENEEDLSDIRQELFESGYIKKRSTDKKKPVRGKPLHFISSDGFDIYVGKNNLQNEEITFKLAKGGDWWFHAKKMPGSHVILKTNGSEDIPDRAFEEAAKLAAHYSKSGGKNKTEIDYIQKKHVKKPAGSPAGFVVYYTNFSMVADGDISGLRPADD